MMKKKPQKHLENESMITKIFKMIMKVVMKIVIKIRAYNMFWSLIALIAPKKGAAWLSEVDHEELGRRDAEYILRMAMKYGVAFDVFLDYGCGYGRVAKYVAPHVKKLICADVSSIYLERARCYLRTHPNVKYIKVNGKDIKMIEDHTIDLVYSIGVFVHINKEDAYSLSKEIVRILKPEGIFIVDLPKPGSKWPSFEEYSQEEILKFLEPYVELEKEEGDIIIRYVLKAKKR